MARITWLADELRKAGLTVVEVPGWKGLGGSTWNPTGGIVHATADGAASNPVADAKDDAGAINVIRNGRPGLTGPIANAYQARDGRWHVIADGRCNTALTGTAGPLKGLGNTNLLGIEHENDNRSEGWPAVQYDSAIRGWAAICKRLGWSASRLAGHKEHDPARKSDPKGIDMTKFRADVAAAMEGDGVSQADVIAALRSAEGKKLIGEAVWNHREADPADPEQEKGAKPPAMRMGGWARYEKLRADNRQKNIFAAVRAAAAGDDAAIAEIQAKLEQVPAVLAELAGKDVVDEQALADALLPKLSGSQLEQVIRNGLPEAERKALAARLAE